MNGVLVPRRGVDFGRSSRFGRMKQKWGRRVRHDEQSFCSKEMKTWVRLEVVRRGTFLGTRYGELCERGTSIVPLKAV